MNAYTDPTPSNTRYSLTWRTKAVYGVGGMANAMIIERV